MDNQPSIFQPSVLCTPYSDLPYSNSPYSNPLYSVLQPSFIHHKARVMGLPLAQQLHHLSYTQLATGVGAC